MTARPIRRLAPLALAATLLLIGCSGGGDTTAQDPATGTPTDPATYPSPLPRGTVASRGLVMVEDIRGDVEICLGGGTRESYPPQCDGPPLVGWDWRDHPEHEQEGETRWGSFAVTGTWDGETFTLLDAVPAALYDAAPDPDPAYPPPTRAYSDDELATIASDLFDTVSGAQGHGTDGSGHAVLEVAYDDGSLQDAVDAEYGADVVIVTSALVEVPVN